MKTVSLELFLDAPFKILPNLLDTLLCNPFRLKVYIGSVQEVRNHWNHWTTEALKLQAHFKVKTYTIQLMPEKKAGCIIHSYPSCVREGRGRSIYAYIPICPKKTFWRVQRRKIAWLRQKNQLSNWPTDRHCGLLSHALATSNHLSTFDLPWNTFPQRKHGQYIFLLRLMTLFENPLDLGRCE